MNLVGHLTQRFVPAALEQRLHFLKDACVLRTAPRQTYDIGRLRRRRTLQLADFLYSAETNKAWEASRSQLEAFDIPDGTGGVNPGDRRAVFHLVHALKPRSVLEVGTHIGASTVHIAAALKSNRDEHDIPGKLTTVDITDVNSTSVCHWLEYGGRHSPREMVEQMNCQDMVTFVADSSLNFAPNCNEKFDLIFLDGDHSAGVVYREVALALKLLNPQGVILLHDYFPGLKPLWPGRGVVTGPWMATEQLRREGTDVTVVPMGALPWATKCGSNNTSLALLLAND